MLQEEVPDRLPKKRSVDHEIKVDSDSKPTYLPLFQLSPSELESAKESVESLLNKGNIRPKKSPYGASFSYVKNKNTPLRGVDEY